MKNKISLTAFIMIFIINTTTVFGFAYGDKGDFIGLEQFAGQNYVIYKNADNDCTELAVIYVDDIQDRSIMIERKEQTDIINEYLMHYGGETSLDVAAIERPKLSLIGTDTAPYISKWRLNGNDWMHVQDTTEEAICDNTEDLIFSNVPVIEVIKKKMKNPPYPRNYNGVSFSEFDTDSNGKYLLFSQDGLNYNIRVKTPDEDNNKYCAARKSYYGNGIILVMGVNEFENLPEFKRMKGYSNDIIYILNSDYEIINKVYLNTLRECAGFYNGYFYFYDKDYYENYKYNEYYYKSDDGINLISITKEEYDISEKMINERKNTTELGYIATVEYDKEIDKSSYYLSDYKNADSRYLVEFEKNRGGFSTYTWSDSKIWANEYFYRKSDNLENLIAFVTIDGIYGSVRLPADMPAQISYVMWATEDYVFIDVDRETYYRIPIEDSFKKNTIVRLNDKILGFSQPPVMESDRTLVPMRFLFEQMGAEVAWDEATQSATASVLTGEGTPRSVTFAIDKTTATVNGITAVMDVPVRLINNQTFVPLRFLSENLGYTVDWDEAANTAIVLTK